MTYRITLLLLFILLLSTPLFALDDATLAARSLALHSTGERVDTSSFYKPIAPWCGRLIMPSAEQRESDGSVLIEVYEAPIPQVRGKILRLRWDGTPPGNNWFEVVRTAVHFDAARKAKNLKKLVVIPTRLDGLDNVSPLESLAAARPVDDMEVALPGARYSGNSIIISEMPVQISGAKMALVQFQGSSGGGFRTVVHYNPASGQFDGPTEKVAITEEGFRPDDAKTPITSTKDIELSPLNEEGFYLFGRNKSGVFHVQGLEPYQLLALQADRYVTGRNACKKYFSNEHFKGMTTGLTRRTLTIPRDNAPAGQDIPADYYQRAWPEGRMGIIVHLFGGRKIYGKKPALQDRLGLHTGHFSFGVAKVIRCPFTGEKRFDITYLQVYGHTTMGIISGAQKWHTYMGNLTRGWMYALPVSDTIIQLPELAPYDIDGWHTNPLNGFIRAVERMLAVYRVGGGTGISSIRTDISCVQDSHYALYAALQMFHDTFSKSEKLRSWIETNGKDHPGVKRFLMLSRLVRDLGRAISPLGIVRKDWKENYENPIGTREPGLVGKLIRSLLSARSMFPRKGYDNFLKLASDKGYHMWTILSAQIGGKIPGISPWPATSPTSH